MYKSEPLQEIRHQHDNQSPCFGTWLYLRGENKYKRSVRHFTIIFSLRSISCEDLLLRRKKIEIIYHKSFFLKLFMVGYIVKVIVYIKSLLKESKLIKDVAFTPSLNKELFFVRVKFIIIILHLALCNLSSLSS